MSDATQALAPQRRPLILAAENDPSHRFVTRRVFAAVGVKADLHFVSNGRELLDYLERCKAGPSDAHPWPNFVLLDLHMPDITTR